MPFTFNAVELCVVSINEKPWTRAKEVCKALKYNKKIANVVKNYCGKKNYAQKYQLSSIPAVVKLWIGQKIHKNTIFISMRKGCTSWYILVNSQRQNNF